MLSHTEVQEFTEQGDNGSEVVTVRLPKKDKEILDGLCNGLGMSMDEICARILETSLKSMAIKKEDCA